MNDHTEKTEPRGSYHEGYLEGKEAAKPPMAVAMQQPPLSAEMAILDRAIQSDRSATEISEIVQLVRQMQKDKAEAAHEAAMVRVQARAVGIKKRGQAQIGSSSTRAYHLWEDVVDALMPIWTEEGLRLSFTEEKSEQDGWLWVRCIVGHKDGHSKTYAIEVPRDGAGNRGMNQIQGVGSSHAYSRRYLVADIFPIPRIGQDNDGERAISSQQIGQLQQIINDLTGYVGKKAWHFQKFLDWMQIESIEKMPASVFAKALAELQSALAKRKKEDMP